MRYMDSNLFIENWMSWLALITTLVVLAYTAHIITNEKRVFLKSPLTFDIAHLQIQVPRWWGITEQSDSTISFKRTDTRYDWFSNFKWIDLEGEDKTAQELLDHHLASKNLILDDDQLVSEEWSTQENLKAYRWESTGTKDCEHRVYYDICFIKDDEKKGYLVCESESSILNGLLEGPFFEEVLRRVKKAN